MAPIGTRLLVPNHGYGPSIIDNLDWAHPRQSFLFNTTILPNIIADSVRQSLNPQFLMHDSRTSSNPPSTQPRLPFNSSSTGSIDQSCGPHTLESDVLLSSSDNSPTSCTRHIAKIVSNKRKKKEKDAPRRPLSAYNLFFKDRRADILKNGTKATKGQIFDNRKPSPQDKTLTTVEVKEVSRSLPRVRKGRNPPHHIISFKEMALKVSDQWKNISEDEKQQYQVQACKEKERYQDELYIYQNRKKKKICDRS